MTLNATLATAGTEGIANILAFGVVDYVVFALLLILSAGIGVYFGFFSGENDTTDEYLLGGKRMQALPIAVSLVASQLSALSIITLPAEVYSFGVTFSFVVVGIYISLPVLCYVIIPVFYNNNISNCYEYLELRFNKATRKIVTFSFILTSFFLLPVLIFIPSLAFSQVSGFNIHHINAVVCSICVFYTMFGGIKAVVWTDVLQASIMIVSVLIVGIMGIINVGGLDKVIENASKGNRLDLNWGVDPRIRSSVLGMFIAGVCLWTSNLGLNQTSVQRICALPSLSHARRSYVLFGFIFTVIMFFNCFTGIIMYSKYHDCDPLAINIVSKPDKMMPFFVQDVVGQLKGMPGVFISCVFSAGLGSMSAYLNALTGVVYFDCIKPFINHTERKANLIMKFFVFCAGIYCVLAGFLVEKSNSILQTMMTVGGVAFGATFGVFMLGLLVPKAHGKAALIGLIGSMVLMVCLIIGAQSRIQMGKLNYQPLPSNVYGCDRFNVTLHNSIFTKPTGPAHQPEDNEDFSIFDISFNWYKFVGGILVWIIAIPLSYLIPTDKQLDPKLVSPFLKSFVTYDVVKTEDWCLKETCIDEQNKK